MGLVLADFNADGILDIATAIENSGVSLYRGLGQNGIGDGRFEPYRFIDLARQSWDLAVGDVNRDGAPDLVVGGYDSRFSVLRGQRSSGLPNGEFASPVTFLSDGHLKGLELADLDADGALDLIASTELSWIVLHRGLMGPAGPNGAFGPPIKIAGEAASSTHDIVVADFNLDTKLDVASANYISNSVSVFLGNGAMGFPTIVHHPVTGSPYGLALADVNGDGRPDLIAPAAGEAGFSFLPQRGVAAGFPTGFRSKVTVGSRRTGFGVAAADLNRDGSVDVVMPNYDDDRLVTYPNKCFDVSTPTLVSFVSAIEHSDRIELTWFSDEVHSPVSLQRREAEGEWSEIASLVPDGQGFLRFLDLDVRPGRRYGYRLGVQLGSSLQFMGEAWAEPSVVEFGLRSAFPNPVVDDRLSIGYSLMGSESARLELLDLGGRRRIAQDLPAFPGARTIELELGERFTAGAYWLRLTQAGRVRVMRIVVMR